LTSGDPPVDRKAGNRQQPALLRYRQRRRLAGDHRAAFRPPESKMVSGGPPGGDTVVGGKKRWSTSMPQRNDLSLYLTALDQDRTLIAAIACCRVLRLLASPVR
jgi:hypothetical protein